MEKFISCCGLNCATCEAWLSTINNDEELRKATAKKWKALYNAAEITPDMINCTGCRNEGVKIGHWSTCQIRLCATEKGFSTCGECKDMDTCNLISGVHKHVPEAITNLKNLN
jgi:hypothetical protein